MGINQYINLRGNVLVGNVAVEANLLRCEICEYASTSVIVLNGGDALTIEDAVPRILPACRKHDGVRRYIPAIFQNDRSTVVIEVGCTGGSDELDLASSNETVESMR